MGKQDVYESDYLEDNRRFADLINGLLFGGAQIVSAKDLEEADAELSFAADKKTKKVVRDKVRKWKKGGIYFAIFSIENQNYVDYAMVIRSMLAEAMAYHKQWKEKKRIHTAAKDLKEKDEYLSGIRQVERFIPIVTIIVYYGTDKAWDGPKNLYELLDMQGKEELIRPFISDYKINLFDFHTKDKFDEFQTELRVLFEFLRYSDSREKLNEVIKAHPESYSELDEDTSRLISVLAGIDGKHLSQIKENRELEAKGTKTEGRLVDMCKAWEDQKEFGRTEGRAEGRIEEKKTFVSNMLKRRMADIDICELAECDQAFVDEVRQAAG